jgi:hypothetical protein
VCVFLVSLDQQNTTSDLLTCEKNHQVPKALNYKLATDLLY